MSQADESTPEERGAHERRFTRIQALSGAVFALFLFLHLATASAGVAGPGGYDSALMALRRVYRPAVAVEILLIGVPAAVHMACALRKIFMRWRRGLRMPSSWRIRLHLYSGYFLLIVVTGHAFATRIAPLWGTGPTATGNADYAFLAFSLINYPLYFKPYYIVLGLAGAIHLGIGLSIAAKILAPRLKMASLRRAGVALAAVLGLVVTSGVVMIIADAGSADRSRYPEFAAIYQKLAPFLSVSEAK